MTRPAEPPTGPAQPAVLNGWKEIAAHFRKGVRTVQRWEAEMDLPVHRLAGPKGEVVYAVPAELDEWRRLQERDDVVEPGIGEDQLPVVQAAERPAFPAQPAARWGWGMAAAIAAGLVVVAALAWAGKALLTPAPQPAAVKIDREAVTVTDAAGVTLWTSTIPYPLAIPDPKDTVTARVTRHKSVVADIDGDGRREVVVAAVGEALERGELICFDSQGNVKWRRRPDRVATFGHGRMVAPWLPSFFSVGQDTQGLWVAWANRPEFASFVERLDPATGQPMAVYWSAGHVTELAVGTFDGRPALFVGAANNEHRGASLAVYDLRVSEGTAPASDSRYACIDCPAQRPLAFLVFPMTSLARELVSDLGTLPVDEVIQDASGQVKVVVVHGPRYPARFPSVLYRFDARLDLVGADTLEDFRRMRHDLEREGRLPPASVAEDERELLPVLSWDGAKFAEVRPVK